MPRVNAIAGWDVGVTADQVRLFAHEIDAQIQAINQDASVSAADPNVTWDLKMGTAWLAFYAAWKQELAVADSNSWLTFGLGSEYARLRDWQAQARDWQTRIAQISGKRSSIPDIKLATGGDSPMLYLGIGAAAALVVLLILRK